MPPPKRVYYYSFHASRRWRAGTLIHALDLAFTRDGRVAEDDGETVDGRRRVGRGPGDRPVPLGQCLQVAEQTGAADAVLPKVVNPIVSIIPCKYINLLIVRHRQARCTTLHRDPLKYIPLE